MNSLDATAPLPCDLGPPTTGVPPHVNTYDAILSAPRVMFHPSKSVIVFS